MPSTSPSPSKRPSMAERSSSTHSLSSSGRQSNANKGHRVHVVSKHSRNASHGKGLNRLGKVASNANVTAEGKSQRKRSGQMTPSQSPQNSTVAKIKRNSSHAALAKNNSHVNLRKNHSAGALSSKRNRSSGGLQKLGAPPSQKPKENEQKQGVFALGDQSSEDEDEEEWEDSTTQSPEMSRAHSKASTPLRPRTPTNEHQKQQEPTPSPAKRTSDPPEPSITVSLKSAPNLRQALTDHPPGDPPLTQVKPRSARAPPAMSTISAQAGTTNLQTMQRAESARSLSEISQQTTKVPSLGTSASGVGTVSSGSGGVSHFLQPSSIATSAKTLEPGSDDDSTSSFMAHYKPQALDSPEKPRSMLNKIPPRTTPSRTNQKMELQRRETMRAGAGAAGPAGPGALGLNAGSSVSLHSRSGSKAGIRNRSLAGEAKALKQDYETAIRQLVVVRRFRNPILESLSRLQDNDIIPSDAGPKSQPGSQAKSRPQNRREATTSTTNTPKVSMARSPEDKKAIPGVSRPDSQARHSRVQFQLSRQGSHDDIGLTTSQGSPGDFDTEQDGISPEEALIRRIWDTRVIYENEGVQQAA